MDEKIMEINNEELENITGGVGAKSSADARSNTVQAFCPNCNKNTTFIVYSGSRGKCQRCGNVIQI